MLLGSVSARVATASLVSMTMSTSSSSSISDQSLRPAAESCMMGAATTAVEEAILMAEAKEGEDLQVVEKEGRKRTGLKGSAQGF